STETGHPALKVEPSLLPNGFDYLNVVAEDPVGNKSPVSSAQIKVDHTAPSLTLSGTLTAEKVNPRLPSYTLTAKAADGTEAAPQSGISEEKVEVDGKVVASEAPKCATKNCPAEIKWTLEASKYSAGEHTAKITATDAVGLTSSKELKFSLIPSP